jgi:phage baseplate assembly protein W
MSDLSPHRGVGAVDPAFVGRGLLWPLGVDHTGSLALTHGPEDLDRSIRMVLATAPGERVMRPEFGCRIWDLLFESLNANTFGLIAQAVRDAVAQWEPRVAVQQVVVHPEEHERGLVRIDLTYVVKTTNDRRNLVYPFYVIPPEEGDSA